ncbi:hypothetical protein AB8O38_11325 [Saccharomonospora xinjiangensis]|uniref:hypothetical protein n=1 Tax=Saccharomonospora xinjiangensis TaxID=75294 RepID=UPI00350EDF71
MATPTITAAQGGDEPHQEPPLSGLTATAAHYAGWEWLVLRADDRLLLTTNERVSAVELPAAIGAEVQHYLTVRMLAGPVIALPGVPRRWLLLTESADESAPVNLVRLRARGALTHRCGTLVPLPPSRLESGVVTWQVPPSLDGPSLPPFTAVVAAVRAVTETVGLA